MNQIRKIQRRDCRGGGEESRAISGDCALSSGCGTTNTREIKAGDAATAKLPAQTWTSGSGAWEMAQQLLCPEETLTDGFSAWCIPIRSQCASVCGVAHSFAWKCISAQAETGNGPRPARLRTINKLRTRRIFM